MKYMGSKAKYSKEILAAILKDLEDSDWQDKVWVEPFVGAANMIDKVGHVFKQRIGSDINPFLIALLQEIQRGWLPPENLSELEYSQLRIKSKNSVTLTSEEMALIAFAAIGSPILANGLAGMLVALLLKASLEIIVKKAETAS